MNSVKNIAMCLALMAAGIQGSQAAPLFGVPSVVQLDGARSISFGHRSAIPRGYYELCSRGHPICSIVKSGNVRTDAAGAVVATEAILQGVVSVNASVNRQMRARADGQSASADRWTVGGRSGDCEDFSLTKKQRLIRAGWPSSALLIALGRTRTGQDHAVLIVRTDRGDVVLDNLTDDIRAWNRAGIRWKMVQSPVDTWRWHRL